MKKMNGLQKLLALVLALILVLGSVCAALAEGENPDGNGGEGNPPAVQDEEDKKDEEKNPSKPPTAKKGGKKSQGLTLRSLQNRGLAQKKVNSASPQTNFLPS